MRSALVTGATGVIGPELARQLLTAGYQVRVLARRDVPPRMLPASVQIVRGDIVDPDAVRAAVDGMDVVFHLAAKLHINNPTTSLRDEYRHVNVEGTRQIGEAARAAGVRRVVFFSTIAVYGASQPGEVHDETSPASADSLYGATKLEAEALLLSLTNQQGTPLSVALRVAGVYGPRIKGNYRQLVRWLRHGLFIPVGEGLNRRTLIYDRDVAAAALLAAAHPAAAGQIFNVTDGSIHTFNEIVSAIAKVLGRRPPRLHIPVNSARATAAVVDRALRMRGRRALVEPLVQKLIEDMAVSGQRIQRVLGFRPVFDLATGWAETIPQLVFH